MNTLTSLLGKLGKFGTLSALTATLLLSACGGGSATQPDRTAGSVETGKPADPVVVPGGTTPTLESAFLKLANDAHCADKRRKLVRIDERLYFLSTAGSCNDASYANILYGPALDQVLCENHDSLAGVVNRCNDAQYSELFKTILANLDSADLGISKGHRVENLLVSGGYETVAIGQTSGIVTAQTVVIRTPEAFAKLWAAHSNGVQTLRAPAVDFEKNMVIAVFRGWDKPREVKPVIQSVSRTTKDVVVTYAFPDTSTSEGVEIAAVSAPFHIVTVDYSPLPVTFVDSGRGPVLPIPDRMETIEKSQFSSIATERTEVVRDAAAWAALWNEHSASLDPKAKLPAVDFSKDMVIAVFNGERPHSGFSMQIDAVTNNGKKLIVDWTSRSPTPEEERVSLYMAVLTHLNHFVVVPRTDLPVMFVKNAQ